MMDADRIAPKLYLGGAPRSCGPFDAVVLTAMELQNLPLKCQVIRAPLDDAVPSREEIKTAMRAAREVYALRRAGKRVLVTCAQGVNRSALVVALVLMMHGLPAERAIRRIRALRKAPIQPLSNQAFVRALKNIERRARR
jgi:protein-tyrosine phosphatase